MRPRLTGLWRSPEFLRLWAGQTISLFGSQIGGGALRFAAILVLGATPAQLSLLTVAALLPALLLGLPAGVWADRVRRRRLLIAADLARGLLLLGIPLAYALGALRIELLYLVVALSGALTILFDTAYPAFVPSVVQREGLVEANSKLSASDSLAEIAGPPAGGLLVQLVGAPLAVLLDALSFLLSALALSGVRDDPPPIPHAEASWRRELGDGLLTIRRTLELRALVGCVVIQSFVGGIIGSLYDVYLIRELGISPLLVGVTIGVGGVGALLGALIAGPVIARLGLARALIAALVIGSGMGVLLPLAHGPLALPMLLVMQASDVAGAIFAIGALSLRQSVTADALLGRVNAGFGFAGTAAALSGALATGSLVGLLGVRGALAVAWALGLLAIVWLLASPLRVGRVEPAA